MSARPGRALAIIASVAMAAAVAAGLWMTGSPAHQRALRLDAQRVTHLNALRLSVQRYWNVHRALPADLRTVDPRGVSRVDPVSGEDYGYERTGRDGYQLCATFAAASPTQRERGSRFALARAYQVQWQHPAGRHCFAQRVATGR